MPLRYVHPRDEIVMIMRRIYNSAMTTTSGGNLSIREDDGSFWITPSGTDKGMLTRNEIVRVLPDGSVEGTHRPSIEYPFHAAIYRARPDVRAVAHAHPPALVSFSITRTVPDTNILPKAHDICGTVGYAPYAMPGSAALGNGIADEFKKGHNVVLMENHGIVAAGAALPEAFSRMETLDFCARLHILARSIGTPHILSKDEVVLPHEKLNPSYAPLDRGSVPSNELELRRTLISLIHRSCDRGLANSTEGTFSARVGNDFIISPFGIDRRSLLPDDLVFITGGRAERGKEPSKSSEFHGRVYEMHPEVGAVFIAHPPTVLAFSVSGLPFDTRIIPESYVMLHDIPTLSYGSHITDRDSVASKLSLATPAVIIANDCIIVAGKSPLEAFDKLEVAEFSARAVINAKSIGKLHEINDDSIKEIRNHFNI